MTKDDLHELLFSNGFKILEQDSETALFRKVYNNSRFRWYLEIVYDGSQTLTINNQEPEKTLKKLR